MLGNMSMSDKGLVSIWIENRGGDVVYRNSVHRSMYYKCMGLLKKHFTQGKGYKINTFMSQSRGMLLSINNGQNQ